MVLYLFKKVPFHMFLSLIWHYQSLGIIIFYMSYEQLGRYFLNDDNDFKVIFRPFYNYLVPFIMGIVLVIPESQQQSRIYTLIFEQYITLVLIIFLFSLLFKYTEFLKRSKFSRRSDSIIKHNYFVGFIMIPHFAYRVSNDEKDFELNVFALV
jgi:L-asparagine transporter-like permease